jgi:hypothetical protein
MPEVDRFAMVFLPTSPLDADDPINDTRIVQFVEAFTRPAPSRIRADGGSGLYRIGQVGQVD